MTPNRLRRASSHARRGGQRQLGHQSHYVPGPYVPVRRDRPPAPRRANVNESAAVTASTAETPAGGGPPHPPGRTGQDRRFREPFN